MLIKTIGAFAVFLSCTLMGFFMASKDRFRAEELLEMKRALTMLKSAVLNSSKPLYEAFIDISEKVDSAVSEIFEDAGRMMKSRQTSTVLEAWDKTLKDRKGRTYFKKEDIDAFLSFGHALGGDDCQWQISNIDMTINYIDTKSDELMKKNIKDGRLFKSAGVLSGILIIVMLY